MSRFFVEGSHTPGDTVELTGSDARKIVTVLRMRSGETVDLVDSTARVFRAEIAIDGRNVRAILREEIAQPDASPVSITVAQGIPKGQKMDFVVEKLTELGVRAIVPLHSERVVPPLPGEAKLQRWMRLARSAAQQCGRTDIPQIAQPVDLRGLTSTFAAYDCVVAAWELAQGARRLDEVVRGKQRVLVIVGPEGGFSEDEADLAQAGGAHLVSLGPRILRTETAGLVAAALVNYFAGG